MLTTAQAFWLQISIIIATFLAPIIAILIAQKQQDRKGNLEAKRNLYLTLYALRGNHTHLHFVNALNTIEAVFDDTPKVLEAWRNYFAVLKDEGQMENWKTFRVALLSSMATTLGYRAIDTSSFVDSYSPVAHGKIYESDEEIRQLIAPFLRAQTEANNLLIEQLIANVQQAEKPQE